MEQDMQALGLLLAHELLGSGYTSSTMGSHFNGWANAANWCSAKTFANMMQQEGVSWFDAVMGSGLDAIMAPAGSSSAYGVEVMERRCNALLATLPGQLARAALQLAAQCMFSGLMFMGHRAELNAGGLVRSLHDLLRQALPFPHIMHLDAYTWHCPQQFIPIPLPMLRSAVSMPHLHPHPPPPMPSVGLPRSLSAPDAHPASWQGQARDCGMSPACDTGHL
jgi:hypothetical protein